MTKLRRTVVTFAVAFATMLCFAAGGAQAAPLSGSSYDSGDGTQVGTPLDWQNVASSSQLTSELGGTTCFGGGEKENTPDGWTFQDTPGGCTPGKSDLFGMWSHSEVTTSKIFLHASFVRNGTTGDSFITFELNQSAATWTNSAGTVVPCRSNGDLLLSFEGSGNSVVVNAYEWTGDGTGPASCPNGANGTFTQAASVTSQGEMSAATIANYLSTATIGSTVRAGAFGEGAVDLGSVIQSLGLGCRSYIQVQVHTRSSSSISSSLIAYLPPVSARIATCDATGTVYENAAGDGVHHAGEPGLAGMTVYVDYNNDATLDPGDPTATTDSSGFYVIPNVVPGTYPVRVVVPSGDQCTAPSPCSYTRTFSATSNSIGNDFELFAPPPAPVVSSPANGSVTNNNEPSVVLTAEAGSTDAVYIDGSLVGTTTADGSGNATLALSSPLADGPHTVYATATDAAGNTSAQSNTNTFTVDTAAPSVTITQKPDLVTTDTSASFGFTSSELGSTFECQLDGGSWAICSSPDSFSGLSLGLHTFKVRATDGAGNVSTIVSYSWTITPTVTPPAPPSPSSLTSSGVGTNVQTEQITIPPGGSVTLLDGGGNPTDTVTVPGQGTYVLDPTTGVISFIPAPGYSGSAQPVEYRVTDAFGQSGQSTYTPTVTKPAAPTASNLVSSGGIGQVQTVTVTVPQGGSVTLLLGGKPVDKVVITGQGTYLLDPATGAITFTPIGQFVGHATPVQYQVTDAYGQTATGTYSPTVKGTPVAPTGKARVLAPSLVVVHPGSTATVPVRCTLSRGEIDRCTLTLVARIGSRSVVVGHAGVRLTGNGRRSQTTVNVPLTGLGRTLAHAIGGKPIRVVGRIDTVGQGLPAATGSRVVAKSVIVPNRPLFNTDKTTLLPSVARYLTWLRHQLAGVRSVTCIGYPDSRTPDAEDAGIPYGRANRVCSFLARGLHLKTIKQTGGSRVPGDLDRAKPVVGAQIVLNY